MNNLNPLQNDALKNLSGVIIFSLDTLYRYTAFTESHRDVMKHIWGVEISLGHSLLDYIHRDDDREKARRNFDSALRGESPTMEEEYGEGSQRTWWEDRYSPIYNEEGEVVGLTVFVLDITSRKQIEQALRVSEINYRSIMDQAADGIFIAGQNGRYLDVNRAGCEMLGYTRDEILGMSMQELAVENKSNPIRFEDLFEGKSIINEREMKRKDGSLVSVEINGKLMEDGRLIGIVRNITERKQEEARMRFLAFVMDRISGAIISTDSDLKITHWNRGAEILYGWREEEVLGRLVNMVCGTEFLPGQRKNARRDLLEYKNWRGELLQHHRDGHEIWVDASVTLLENNEGAFIGGVTINQDVTERKKAEEEQRRTKEAIENINLILRNAFEREQVASRTDGLTGVFNRRYFFELLEYEFSASRRYERPLSLVMFDLDNLKKINDTHGHQVGDELLKQVSQTARQHLRETDVLARYGGDEFVILVPNSDEQETVLVMQRVQHQLRSLYVVAGGQKVPATVSIGVATLLPDLKNADQLVSHADQALYAAKSTGRDQIVVYNGEQNGFEN